MKIYLQVAMLLMGSFFLSGCLRSWEQKRIELTKLENHDEAKTECKESNMKTTKRTDVILIETQPNDKPYVRIVGEGWTKSGYIIWRPGLTLREIEVAIGYNKDYPVPIFVSIYRDNRRLFDAMATERGPGGAFNAGPIREKPKVPELAPGDSITASRPLE